MNGEPAEGARAVLLTGATGSLGGYLCKELLQKTAASVYCLVRAPDTETARQRLRQRLTELGCLTPRRPSTARRPRRPGPDSLRTHSSPEFDALAETTDTILHAAATVNLAAHYDDLTSANLDAVHRVIALAHRRTALTGHPAGLHHISTLATLLNTRSAGLDTVDENTPISLATSGPQGYPRSKMEAEKALHHAASHGLPVTVYRPGVITGHSQNGQTTSTDPLAPLLTAVAALGAAPAGELWVPGGCVDTVALSITRLMNQAPRAKHLSRHRTRTSAHEPALPGPEPSRPPPRASTG